MSWLGCYRSNNEDEESTETSTAVGRGANAAVITIQATCACNQGQYFTALNNICLININTLLLLLLDCWCT